MKKYDAIIIGCGIAGCITAVKISEKLKNVLLITKEDDPLISNTYHAQGGIIYKGETDSWDILKQDIMFAGGGLSKEDAAGVLCDYGAQDVKEILIKQIGVPFSRDKNDNLDFTDEGAHSQRRIIHCDDSTGEVIIKHIHKYIKEKTNIEILSGHMLLDLITNEYIEDPKNQHPENHCYGVYVLDTKKNKIKSILSNFTVLATGGCGNIYQNTTNPDCATGDGYAVGLRAGANLTNMEFTQFHPTTLYHASGDRFLISESVRGEGAIIKTPQGEAFMSKYHQMKDLAPRDIVTRSILDVMLKKSIPCVFLDCSQIKTDELKTRFPKIYKTCLEKYHFDITKSWIPITPAFHFMCGGIKTDTYGRTNIHRLYAVGETACTGVHGANRLASTSLLEGLVFGVRVAEDIINRSDPNINYNYKVCKWKLENDSQTTLDPVIIQQMWQTLKSLMWNFVGPIRNKQRLKFAKKFLIDIEETIEELIREHKINKQVLELRNAIQTGVAIAKAARNNKKSAGCHYLTD